MERLESESEPEQFNTSDDDVQPQEAGGLDSESEVEELDEESRFKTAVTDIKRGMKFTRDIDVADFFAKHGDIAEISLPEVSGNLLHTIVEATVHNNVEPEDVQLLVQRLVRKYPSLLEDLNKDRQNPVFKAIRESKHKLVDYMVSACIEDKTGYEHVNFLEHLDKALKMPVDAEDSKTCLHIAFDKNLEFNDMTLELLIENASRTALAMQDRSGKTPMHHAVAFPECTAERVKLIQLFIKRDLEETQGNWRPTLSFLDVLDKYGRSVFKEHQMTRDSEIRKHKNDRERQREKQAQSSAQAKSSGENSSAAAVGKGMSNALPREPRRIALARTIGDRGSTDKSHRRADVNAGDDVDEREKRRQKMKEEEALKREAEAPRAKGDWLDQAAARKLEAQKLAEKAARRKLDGVERLDNSSEAPSRGGGDRQEGTAGGENLKADDLRLRITDSSGNQLTQRTQEPSPNTPIKRTNTARLESRADGGRDKDVKLPRRPKVMSKKSSSGKKPPLKIRDITKNSDQITQSLRLHYMRTRNTERVISFLYGTNMEDIQVVFDYDRLPRNMNWKQFERRFGADYKSGLKFSNVLQYVTFPQVEVRLSGPKADMEQKAEAESPQLGPLGRKDMRYFFDWLYSKGVRHIIRLSVEDSGDGGEKVHADQFIRESLERFIVEHLDWRKKDLDPETILHVSSRVEKRVPTAEDRKNVEVMPDRQMRELSLRWGGSNAVLRAWSEPEGLPLLPRLQSVYLFKPLSKKMYEGPHWVEEKLKEFATRLNSNRRIIRQAKLDASTATTDPIIPDAGAEFGPVEVKVRESGAYEDGHVASGDSPHTASTFGPAEGVNSHRWLISTGRFAFEMAGFWASTRADFLASQKTQGTLEGIEDDIILALIDDGVDMFDATFQSDRILEGKSFDYHNGKVRPPFSSAKGHGTVMASMILSVCPMVKIYPIRLKTYDNTNGKSTIDMLYAAQAIQAALDKKATIISMSWSLPIEGANQESQAILHNVLKKAVDSGVLMFCAAPDEGKFSGKEYPSGPWPDKFFRVGAAKADGTVFAWTPSDQITYVLPGVDVIKDQVGNSSLATTTAATTTNAATSGTDQGVVGSGGITPRVVNFEFKTGSSVATALAAGLAAMIIYCVKASILAVKTANQNINPMLIGQAIPDNGAITIASPAAMKRAFASLGTVTPNKFIQVWEELDKVSDQLALLRQSQQQQTAAGANSSDPNKLQRVDYFVKFGQKLANSSKQ